MFNKRGKSEMKTYKKTELARLAGINAETLRYYEKIGVLSQATRQANGYRVFNERHLDELKFIKSCRSLGFSLDNIQALKQLQMANNTAFIHNADEIAAAQLAMVDEKIRQLSEIKATLLNLSRCDKQGECKVMTFLNASA